MHIKIQSKSEPAVIVLPGEVPSKKNSRRLIQNKHTGKKMSIPSKAYQEWEQKNEMELLRFYKLRGAQKVGMVAMKFYVGTTQPCDLTNKAESVMDLLVKGRFLRDDNFYYVPRVFLEYCGLDRKNPRVEIFIYQHEA
jgi:hypothetical protein